MKSIENLEETKVPSVKVNIRRRKSDIDVINDSPFFKSFLKESVEPKTSIPVVEVLYESLNTEWDEPKPKSSCSKCRPPNSPISVILRSQGEFPNLKKIAKSRLKQLPRINKKHNLNIKDVIIAGNSVKYYDWLSTFLNFPSMAKENVSAEKSKHIRMSSTPIKNVFTISMRRKPYKSKYKPQARFFSK